MTNTAAMAGGKGLNSSDGASTLRKRPIILMSDTSGEETRQRKCPSKWGVEFCFVTPAFYKSTLRELGPLTGLQPSDCDPIPGVVRLITRDHINSRK